MATLPTGCWTACWSLQEPLAERWSRCPKKPIARPSSTWRWNRAIQEIRQTAAGDVRASILHNCPSIDTLADDFLSTPDFGCYAWEFAPDVSTQCEKVMTFAAEQNHVSNVGLALEIDWQRRMGIIAQRGPPPLPPKAKAETRAEQRRMAGECLCGAGGGKQRSFCNRLMRLIKFRCLVGSRNRTTLKNGSVVLALLPRNLQRTGGQ